MKSVAYVVTAVALAAGTAIAADAATFTGTYPITANTSGAGLQVQTANVLDISNFVVNTGSPVTTTLFQIWTNEASVEADDRIARPISVLFNFTLPGVSSGSIAGETDGDSTLFGVIQSGSLSWTGAGSRIFDFTDGTRLRVTMADATFNRGFFGLNEGQRDGANVQATFKLLREGAVPEPATWAMLIAGFGLVGGAMRRRPTQVTVTA